MLYAHCFYILYKLTNIMLASKACIAVNRGLKVDQEVTKGGGDRQEGN